MAADPDPDFADPVGPPPPIARIESFNLHENMDPSIPNIKDAYENCWILQAHGCEHRPAKTFRLKPGQYIIMNKFRGCLSYGIEKFIRASDKEVFFFRINTIGQVGGIDAGTSGYTRESFTVFSGDDIRTRDVPNLQLTPDYDYTRTKTRRDKFKTKRTRHDC